MSKNPDKEKERIRDRKRYARNKESKLAKMKEWRDGNPGYFSDYHSKNQEKRLEFNHAWRDENIEKELARGRKHYQDNPELYAVKGALRRANSIGNISAQDYEDIKIASIGICPYCNQKIVCGHFDHIVSLSKGGKNTKDNLVYCCAHCNLSKGNKSLLWWFSSLFVK